MILEIDMAFGSAWVPANCTCSSLSHPSHHQSRTEEVCNIIGRYYRRKYLDQMWLSAHRGAVSRGFLAWTVAFTFSGCLAAVSFLPAHHRDALLGLSGPGCTPTGSRHESGQMQPQNSDPASVRQGCQAGMLRQWSMDLALVQPPTNAKPALKWQERISHGQSTKGPAHPTQNRAHRSAARRPTAAFAICPNSQYTVHNVTTGLEPNPWRFYTSVLPVQRVPLPQTIRISTLPFFAELQKV